MNDYRIIGSLGRGMYGYVRLVEKDNKMYAMKESLYDSIFINEVKILELIRDTLIDTHICENFTLIYEWGRYEDVEEDLTYDMGYIIMEKADGDLESLIKNSRLTYIDIVSITFQLLYAMFISKDSIELDMRDVRTENVLYKHVHHPHTITIDDMVYTIPSIKIMYSDFGLSMIGDIEDMDDLYKMTYIIEQLHKHIHTIEYDEMILRLGSIDRYEDIPSLFSLQYFDSIRTI